MDNLITVVSLQGQAWAVALDGSRRELQVGDTISANEMVVTAEGAQIDLQFANNQILSLIGEQEASAQALQAAQALPLSAPLTAINTPQTTSVPANLSENVAKEGHNFVPLVHIAEIIEADGFTPLTVARIQEIIKPLGMVLPERDFEQDRWKEHVSYREHGSNIQYSISIDIDVIADDDIINAAEAQRDITVTGTVGGDVKPGDKVTVTVNGKTYETTVNADGKTWNVDIPGSELVQDKTVEATVTGKTPTGETITADTERPYEVRTELPKVEVELEGAGPDGVYNESEIINGKVPAIVTLDPNTVKEGDILKVTTPNGDVLLERPVTQGDIDNGVPVQVPVTPGQTTVTVEATITDPAGNSSSSSDTKPVDNLPPELVGSLNPQNDADADDITLDLSKEFNDVFSGKDLTYQATDLPTGLKIDPKTSIISGKIDSSASQGGNTSTQGDYKVTITVTDPAGNSSEHEFVWTVTNPDPTASDDTGATDEDTSLVVAAKDGVLQNDNDPDGDQLYVTGIVAGETKPAAPGGLNTEIKGKYGTLTLQEDGSYVYTPNKDNPEVRALKDGETLEDTFSYTMTDREGGEDDAVLRITINGVTDSEPTITPEDHNNPDDPTDPLTAGHATVYESGLVAGGPAGQSKTAAGEITVDAKDGLVSVSVAGQVFDLDSLAGLQANPVTIITDYGELTLTGFTPEVVNGITVGGKLSYSYELTKPFANAEPSQAGDENGLDKIELKVVDAGNAESNGTLDINIIDDVPVARDDANSITEDTTVPATGNVFGSKNASAGDVEDTQGADGSTVTGVQAGAVTAGSHVADGNLATQITGKYGTLTLNADGTYSYELDNTNLTVQGLGQGETLKNEVFSYTITDKDGDKSTATLTITINGSNDGVTVNVPTDHTVPVGSDGKPTNPADYAKTDDHVVFESGLVGGSSPDADATKVVSSFTLKALDGLDPTNAFSIKYKDISGVEQTFMLGKDAIEALGATAQTITTQYGELKLNGYSQAPDGTITINYDYLLNTAPTVTGDAINDDFVITVKDKDIDTAVGTISIKIVDDAPVAVDDANSITEDATTPATGNVFGATDASADDKQDTQGADGATVTGVQAGAVTAGSHVADGNLATQITGKYGTLTLNADGTYSYELDNTNLTVQGLGQGETLEDEVFSYTITDKDGDKSTATLTITINGSNDGVTNVPTDHTVPLGPDGKPTNPADYAKTDDQVVFESGLTGGSNPDADATKVVSYFTLTALDGLDPTNALSIKYKDNNGDEQTFMLGKDAIEALGTTSQTITTQYGELNLNGYSQAPDGTITINYDYLLNTAPTVTGDAINDDFVITVKDKDVDTAVGTISIKIVDDAPVAVYDANSITEDATTPATGNVFGATDASADDKQDTQGADGATVTGVQAGAVTAGSHVADGNLATQITGKYGTLTLNADGTYSYELDNTNLTVQGLGQGETLKNEVFSYTITDKDGDKSTATLTITINGSNDGVTVNVPTDHTVPVDSDGKPTNYTKTNDHVVFESGLTGGSKPNADATKVVSSFTLKALDGLDPTNAFSIKYKDISGVEQTFMLGKDAIEALGATAQTITTQYGELKLNGYSQAPDGTITINYDYLLNTAPTVTGDAINDDFVITVKDKDVDTAVGTISIKIVDDAPVAVDDANSITEDATTPATGNVFGATDASADDKQDTQGADGATVTGVQAGTVTAGSHVADSNLPTDITGKYGTLTLNADGTYSYKLDNTNLTVQSLGAGATLDDEVFSYTITDKDGDKSTATLTITINGSNDGVTVNVPTDHTVPVGSDGKPTNPADYAKTNDHVVFESGLTGGSKPDAEATKVVSSFTLKALDGLDPTNAFSIKYKDISGVEQTFMLGKDAIEALGTTAQTITTQYGELKLNGYSQAPDGTITINYDYLLNTAPTVTGDAINDDFVITVKDKDVDTAVGTISIKIVDDAPVAVDDANSITEDATTLATGNVFGATGASANDKQDTQGADGATITGVQSGTVTAGSHVADSNLPTDITGKYGTLTLNADGTYSYKLDNTNLTVQSLGAGATLDDEVFSYTITDSDGDKSTATLTITINGSNDGVTVNVPTDHTVPLGPDGKPTNPADYAKTNDHVVFESGLTGGSKPDAEATKVVSSFTLKALDGLDPTNAFSITYKDKNGVEQTLTLGKDAIEVLGTTAQTITTQYGELKLNGYSQAADGTITINYDYLLNTAPTVTGDAINDDFVITVKDKDVDTAVGTISIKIIDDAPTAVDDKNTVDSGFYAAVTGNVIGGTDASTNDEADVVGADGAKVTVVKFTDPDTNNETEITLPTNGTSTTIDGTYGVLTIQSDGSYSYKRNPGKPGGVEDEFTYTLTDGDGDTDIATLTIDIADAGVLITHLTPKAGGGDATVYEGMLTGGTGVTDGVGAVGDKTADGTFKVSSPDGIKELSITQGVNTYSLIDNNGAFTPKKITTELGNTLNISAYEESTGTVTYTYTLASKETHSAQGQDNLFENFTVNLKDMDNDSATNTLSVRIVDDIPVITQTGTALPTLTVDESDFNTNATANFSGLFGVNHGADGAATSNAVVYTLDVNTVSGLVDTASNEPVALTVNANGTVVTGTAGGNTVFTITIDSATGEITLDQLRAVKHSDITKHNDAVSIIQGAVSITATATDGDGDKVTSTIAIGDRFTFLDDGPSIAVGVDTGAVTVLTDLVTKDAETLTGASTTNANFAGAFIVASSDYRADGDGGTLWAYTLDLKGEVASLASGLSTGGDAINLYVVGSQIVGSTAATSAGITAGNTAFTVTVDGTGQVALTQQLPIDHSNTNSSNETIALVNDLITLTGTATITDGDGDTASSSQTINIGDKFVFTDDGPTVGAPVDSTVNEANLAAGSATDIPALTKTGSLAIGVSADGVDTQFTSTTLDNFTALGLTSGGTAISYALSADGHTLTASAGVNTVFTATITNPSAANAGYTFVLSAPLDHVKPANDTELELPFNFIVTDKDGDTATGSFKVTVVDNVPVAENDTNTVAEASYTAVTGNVISTGTGKDTVGADGATVTQVVFNGTSYNVPTDNPDLVINAAYGDLTIKADGSYSYQRTAGTAGGVNDEFAYTLTDGDGDTANATLTVNITDAGVSITELTPQASDGDVTVLESKLTGGTGVDTGAATASGTFTISSPDGIAELSITHNGTTTNLVLSNTTQSLPTITTALGNTLAITGYNASTGVVSYTYTLLNNETHTAQGQDALFENFTVNLKDMDNDSATNTLSVRIVDDIPLITQNTTNTVALEADESDFNTNATADFSGLFTINHGADGEAASNATVYTLSTNGSSGLVDTASGKLVELTVSGSVITGTAGTDTVFTITIDSATGKITLDQLRAVKHSDITDHNDAVSITQGAVSITATATDGDGDEVTSTIAIGDRFTFLDDGPSITANIDDDKLPDSLVTKDAETLGSSTSTANANFAGAFIVASSDYGADGNGGTVWNYALGFTNASSGLTSAGKAITLAQSGDTITGTANGNTVFTIAVNPSTGEVTLTQYAAIDHGAAENNSADFSTDTQTLAANIVTLTGTATITDGDGDTASSSQIINIGDKFVFTDDGPTVGTPVDSTVNEANLAAGSAADIPALTKTGSLAIGLSADGVDTQFTSTTLDNFTALGLTSGGTAISYALSADGHTLTATADVNTVFTATITNPTAANAGYKFVLSAPLDHVKPANDTELELPFNFIVTDKDGDTATGSFKVTVVDNVPVAADDTNTVAEASYTAVTGNVISTGTGKDTVGADGATVTQVVFNGTSYNVPADNPDLVINAAYGDLTIKADGSYSYQRTAGTPGGVNDEFAYTLTDGDGDTANATLTVNITDAGVSITELTPQASDGDVTVLESKLTGGTGVDTGAATASGTFTISSPDGIQELSVTQGANTYSLIDNNGAFTPQTITTALGNTLNITAYNPTTGVVTYNYELISKETHTSGGGRNDLFENFTVNLKDMDNDSATNTLSVRIVDDIPLITQDTTNTVAVKVDESDFAINATANFSGLFGVNHGADGAATSNAVVYTLDVNAVSGLVDTASGENVVLSVNGAGTLVTGTAGGNTVFTININSAGEVTLDQLRAVKHSATADHNDAVSITKSAVSITATATDGDGDVVTNTINIGNRFAFKDDGPAITVDTTKVGAIELDESNLTGASHSITVANFADGVFTTNFGADGAASTAGFVYSLAVSDNAVNSGLKDTASGKDILLRVNGSGDVEGYVTAGSLVVFTVSVDGATGALTLEQFRALSHSNTNKHDDVVNILNDTIQLVGTATDGDGDTAIQSINIGEKITFRDDGPSITAVTAETKVDEKGLPAGSDPGANLLSASASLNVDFGADGAGDVQFTTDTTDHLNTLGLKAGGTALEFVIDNNSHTLTAYIGTGRDASDKVFTVDITDPKGVPGYSFVLHAPIDHAGAADLTLAFKGIQVTDGDGDSVIKDFDVKVIDDAPATTIARTIDEDSDGTSFNTSADANPTNTTIFQKGTALAGTSNDKSGMDYASDYGTVTVNADGTITYIPKANYSGEEVFVFKTQDGTTTDETTVTVTVTPVADAPGLEGNKTLITDEDVSIALGLKMPVITDATDQNGVGVAGDNPERLGEITLTLTGDAIGTLTNAAGDVSYTDIGVSGVYKFVITDVTDLHLDGLTSGDATVNYVTQAEYEAIKALPAADRHENFDVEVSVKSYEVDASGAALPDAQVGAGNGGINGAESTQTITVDVRAVTDAVGLKVQEDVTQTDVSVAKSGSDKVADITLNEDNSFNLTSILNPDAFVDTDGSETRYLGIHGLPDGTVVNVDGNSFTIGQAAPAISTFDFGDGKGLVPVIEMPGTQTDLPVIRITPPKDFSGDINGLTVTLGAIDSDSDSTATALVLETDAVTINLHVQPAAGEVEAGNVTTQEDTAVDFMKLIKVTDTSTGSTDGGKEIITQVAFTLPTDWKLTDKPAVSSDWEITGDDATGYVIKGLNGYDLQNVLKDFTVTPLAHSSADKTIKVTVTTADTNTVDGTSVTSTANTDLDIKVTVTPVAEVVGGNTGGSSADLTMMGDRDYTTAGEEDEWFDLGTDDGKFNFSDGWANEDSGSEKTYALLTPELVVGAGSQVTAIGSTFRYKDENDQWVEETYVGDPIEVPMEFLDSLEFKAAPDFAGMFKIKVQAKTVDFDEDHPTDLSKANIAISGEATLTNVLIKPKADTSTTSLTARVQGDEDEMMALSIRPSSSDKNETFNVTVGAVPAGATLTYGDYAITKGGVFEHSVVDGNVVFGNPVTDAHITVTADGDNPWKVDFVEFDNDKPMTITPPKDSNKDFTLSVSTVTVDKLVIPADPNVPGSEEKIYIDKSDPEKLTVVIAPKGVADPAEFELSANLEYTEAVAESTGINVSGLIAKAELKDDDGSETLTFKIGGLPAGFKVEGATFMGGTGTDREWSFNEATLNNVIIKAPANFNGIFDFSLYTVTTENDGDSRTEEHSVSLTITPTPEATMNLSASIDEDVSAALDFSVIHQNGDIDESISKVWIKVDSVKDGLTLTLGNGGPALSTTENIGGDDYYVVEQGDLNNIYAQGATNWHGDTSLEVRYEVTDPGNDGLANVSTVTDSTYEITVTPVADGITLSPTASSGKEGEIIGLNLDAKMKDLYQAGDTDSSIETATLQFKGLGEFTSFYIDRVLAMNKVAYDKAAGVYTISGLSQDDIDKLGFVQAQNDIGSLQVRGQTVESANGDTSDWTHPDVGPWAAITTTITQQLSTTESDTLLWTGNAINGLGVGDTDTIQLRFGESLSSTQLASKLSNIEVLDLSIGGANSITGLTIEDVMRMTDGRNTLSIFGDAEDSVTLGSGWGAGVKGTDTTIYTASLGAETVKLEVSNLLID